MSGVISVRDGVNLPVMTEGLLVTRRRGLNSPNANTHKTVSD